MASPPVQPGLPASRVLLLAVGAGVSVASIYVNQPVLARMASDLGVSARAVGLVPTLTQLGYALGIVLLAPLGDRLDRRRVIVAKGIGLAVALVAAALAPSVLLLGAASLAIGLLATIAQDYVPAAAALAAPEARGRAVGRVMTGLLLGILLSRVVSGVIAEHAGWRTVFLGAAGLVAALVVVSRAMLPAFEATTSQPYPALLASMARLARDLPTLRRAAMAQGLLSVAFSGFWSTLALGLAAPPFHLGSGAAGAFGLAGAAGALVAPLAGSFADRRGPLPVVRAGAGLVAATFALMALFPGSLAVLVLGTLLFDLGVQAALIAHQTLVYGLEPSARSRLNAVLVSSMFVGMSAGSALASAVFGRFGWTGVLVEGACAAAGALVLQTMAPRAQPAPAAGE